MGFVTIGQSPRDDLVPEMVEWAGTAIEAVQFGALDGLGADEIRAMAPANDEPRLVSRLRDGTQVEMQRSAVHERVRTVLRHADDRRLDVLVLLCTGRFPAMGLGTPFVSSQAAVDHGVMALAADVRRLGVMVPTEAQAREVEGRGWGAPTSAAAHDELRVEASHATPYGLEPAEMWAGFDRAARDLADADLVVMHCMGYDRDMLERVRRVAGRPTLLARSLVASALRQLL